MDLAFTRSRQRAFSRIPGFGSIQNLARTLACSSRRSGRLYVVGTSAYEPWHLAAHLQTSPEFAQSQPTLVRWAIPDGAPPHLTLGLDHLARTARTDTVLVVAADQPGEDLLEHLADARRHGSTILGLASEGAGDELSRADSLAHEVAITRADLLDLAQHYLPLTSASSRPGRGHRPGLARLRG